MKNVTPILNAASLGIVELVWLTAATDSFMPREGREILSVETVYLVTWEQMAPALDKWEKQTDDPNHLDVIHKVREAAESLVYHSPVPPFDDVNKQLNAAMDRAEKDPRGWAYGLSYEQGVVNALRWMLGETEEKPMEE